MISSWILHLVPWWGWLILLAVVVGGIWHWFGWRGALAGLTAGLALFGYAKGRKDQQQITEQQQEQKRQQSINDKKEIDDEVAKMDSDAVDDEYSDWLRHDKR